MEMDQLKVMLMWIVMDAVREIKEWPGIGSDLRHSLSSQQ